MAFFTCVCSVQCHRQIILNILCDYGPANLTELQRDVIRQPLMASESAASLLGAWAASDLGLHCFLGGLPSSRRTLETNRCGQNRL